VTAKVDQPTLRPRQTPGLATEQTFSAAQRSMSRYLLFRDNLARQAIYPEPSQSSGIRTLPPGPFRTLEEPMIDTRTAPYAASCCLALGVMFVAHALLKILSSPCRNRTVFQSGLPACSPRRSRPNSSAACCSLGVGTRWAALRWFFLLGATWAHIGNGWTFSAPNGGWEYPVFLTAAAFAQFLLGDGAYALGSRLGRRAVPRLQAA
jgi:putative oxidoreductase